MPCLKCATIIYTYEATGLSPIINMANEFSLNL